MKWVKQKKNKIKHKNNKVNKVYIFKISIITNRQFFTFLGRNIRIGSNKNEFIIIYPQQNEILK